jgi:Phage portal protein, SPP1 Gp6-like
MALAIVSDVTDPITPGREPEWWLRRLHARILARRRGLIKVKRYYNGDFEWKYADRKLRRVFGHVFYESRLGVNWMRLVVIGTHQRLRIDGIRIGNSKEMDPDAWKLWQAARLDARSAKAHHVSLLYGASYVTVWKGEDEDGPVFKIDHPATAAVELDPDDELTRLAGLRTYMDEVGYLHAQLFLPERVYLYRSSGPIAGTQPTQERSSMDWMIDSAEIAEGQMDNPYGTVPMVPFINGPSAEWPGESDDRWLIERSELHGVMPIQDALNSVLVNALLVSNAQGFRQRWATGLEVKLDAQGRPIPPFQADIDRLWQAESSETKFGDFNPTDVSGLITLIDQLVRQLAAASQIPPHYLEPQAERLSADSIRAAESGLISKIRDKQMVYGDAWEEVMRLAGLMTGNQQLAQANAAEIVWQDPETHTMAALYDAALKSGAIGVPWEQRMEFLGYTPQAIERMRQMRAEDALLNWNPDVPVEEQAKTTAPQPWGSPVPPTTLPPSVPQPGSEGGAPQR